VGGLVSPAYAAPLPSPLAGLPLPDRATSDPSPGPGAAPTASPSRDRGQDRSGRSARTVRVVPGDTLWALALSDLPDGASPAEVDERWRTIHAANHGVIGSDPDLILPGQELRLPPGPPPVA
jgi:nucleoid-associated protein YgaU